MLVSLDILLEWREHFKLGCPISNAIAAKLEFLNKKLDCVSCIVAKTCAIGPHILITTLQTQRPYSFFTHDEKALQIVM